MILRSAPGGAAALGLALVLVTATADAQQPPAQERVRGQVVALDGKALKVKSRDGKDVTVMLADNYQVSAVIKADFGDIKQNSYVGTAAVPQRDGTLLAQEVLIFPEPMRGTGEGHRPWDLTPESTMTNATVETVVTDVNGRTLKLKYKDGEKQVVVPPEAPIVTFAPGDAAMIEPGQHVFIIASKAADSGLSAARVMVGKDGLVPPM